jgi:hypothetical protein
MSHIAGTRMIASGVDGLLRGNLTEGLLLQPEPSTFSSFVPLHLSAIQRSPQLLSWLRSWIPYRGITPLTPTDWFVQGQGLDTGGTYIPGSGRDPNLPSYLVSVGPCSCCSGDSGGTTGSFPAQTPAPESCFPVSTPVYSALEKTPL